MKINYFDKISKQKLSQKIVGGREKAGLKNTVWVVLEYSDFKLLGRWKDKCKKLQSENLTLRKELALSKNWDKIWAFLKKAEKKRRTKEEK